MRTSTSTYDGAGRVTTKSLSVTPASAGGTAVPDVTYTYNPATGLQTAVTAGGASVSTAYDTLGRVTSTTDADGNVSTTGYDAAGRVLTVNDGKGTYTYTYDGTDATGKAERRGLVTSVNTGGAGTFTGAYTADVDRHVIPLGWGARYSPRSWP
ncbi:RHS repeat domain-containing protein [Sphaerisporangium album]|uniref:RHS repeat domain-containing protein n=1 Tax=Sphaerisporangium album TaxID=509200 RepID=UPI0015F0A2A0|nr:RHS repeat domain-containing protein [Sphaerisporangium album]